METNPSLAMLESKKIKQLYYAHRNIRALCVLWILGASLLVMGLVFLPFKSEPLTIADYAIMAFLAILVVLQIVAVVGLCNRPKWGRILGIVVACLSALNIPIGTVIGLFCIYTLSQAGELFGPDRIRPEELTAEFMRRKASGF